MTLKTEEESLELKVSRVKSFIEEIERALPAIRKLGQGSAELDSMLKDQLLSYGMKINFANVNPDFFKEWQNHPYVLFQEKGMKEYEWKIAVPKWADSIHFGMLVGEQLGHRIFLVSRYIDMVYDLPDWLREKIGAKKDPLDIKLDLSTMQLQGKDVHKVIEKYRGFLKKQDGHLVVDKDQYFECLAAMIEDGIKPFDPTPIPKELFRERRCDFQLRDYQLEAWEKMKKHSMGFVCWPPSAGKTYYTMFLHTHIKSPHLVAVPQKTLQEQWVERLELYTDLKINTDPSEKAMAEADVTVLTYQSAIKHAHKISWISVTVDEGHHLAANEFSKMSAIERKITIGLSATPHREDGRERYLFALFGEGIGIDWETMKKLGVIKNPDLHVWIVKNEKDRMNKLDELLQEDKRTMIFSDEIELGKSVSKKYDIPFVYGDSKDRMNTIRNSRTFIISRVGDEGISLPDVERVIEISFLKGSRRQELQRFTRLLHSKSEKAGEGHIIFDPEEYEAYHKRLFGVMDRGFKIILHREGVSDKVVHHYEMPMKEIKPPKLRASIPRIESPKTPKIEFTDPLLKLAGAQKLLEKCNLEEQKVISTLFSSKEKSFTSKSLIMWLGNQLKHTNFSKLVKFGLIKKTKDGYQADTTLGGAMK